MFKKVISILLATVLVVSMTGCSELTSVVTSTSEPAVNTSVDKPADNTQTSTTASVSASVEETQTSASVSEPEPTHEPEPQPEPEPEGYARYISSPEAWEEMPKKEYDAIDADTFMEQYHNGNYGNWGKTFSEDERVATYIKAIENTYFNGEIPDVTISYDIIKAADVSFLGSIPRFYFGKPYGDSLEVRMKALLFFIDEDAMIYTEYKLFQLMGDWQDVPEPYKGITIDEMNKILREKGALGGTGELFQFD